jgi:hypothetical protein
MKPEHRASILELAPKAKGLDLYVEAEKDRAGAIRSALALKGSMSESEARGLLARTRRVRAKW